MLRESPSGFTLTTNDMKRKGKQINFYITEKELLAFDEYFLESNSALIGLPLKKPQIDYCNTLNGLNNSNYEWSLFLRIARISDISSLVIKYIDTQGYFLIDTLHSPVIEMSKSSFDDNAKKITRGRLFYHPGYFNDNGNWVEKDSEFIFWASQLYKKFSSFIKFEKSSTGDLVSFETNKLVQKGWTLI